MSTNPPSQMIVERLDDIPLLLEHLKRMGIVKEINKNFPVHGNLQGLSLGWTVVIWLTHILSQADHCLCHVQEWVAAHLETLKKQTGIDSVCEQDFTDDRLQEVLRYLNKDDPWTQYEQAAGENLIRVYELPTEVVRLDATTASTYQAENPDGILRIGASKDHRPDLAQLKIMLGTLDPLGLSLVTQVVPGNHADDPLYIPVIKQIKTILNRKGVLHVGDCKMAATETRFIIQYNKDYYLTPLPATIVSDTVLDNYLKPLWEVDDPSTLLTPVYSTYVKGEAKLIALGFETLETIRFEQEDKTFTWEERRLLVRSESYAKTQIENLDKRLTKAIDELNQLTQPRQGKKRITLVGEIEAKVEDILKRYGTLGLLEVTIHQTVTSRNIRGYGNKPQRLEENVHINLEVNRQSQAIEAIKRRLGWRVYATTAPCERFSLENLVNTYRGQYIVEKGNSRLKGQPLSLIPLYLKREDHITGMVRLLSIALCALTLLEFVVCRELSEVQKPLTGLYPGNPKRATNRPSAEIILRAFKNINWVYQANALPFLTPLNPLQRQILKLLNFTEFIYRQFEVTVPAE